MEKIPVLAMAYLAIYGTGNMIDKLFLNLKNLLKILFCPIILIFFFSEISFFRNRSRKSLITRSHYPIRRNAGFNFGDQVVIVGKLSDENPVAQPLNCYLEDMHTKKKNEDTYFVLEDDFFDISGFIVGRVYEIGTRSGEDKWKCYEWFPIKVKITGDSFIH